VANDDSGGGGMAVTAINACVAAASWRQAITWRQTAKKAKSNKAAKNRLLAKRRISKRQSHAHKRASALIAQKAL